MDLHTIYKYMTREHAEGLCNFGRIRIGTLCSYRNTESFGTEIGDSEEGLTLEWSHDKDAKRGDQLNPLEKQVIKAGPDMIVEDSHVELLHSSPKYYIFCASLSYNKSILEQLNRDCPEDKYDACVEVTNLQYFVDEITSAFADRVRYVGYFKCEYKKRKYHYTETRPHPAIIKDPKYSYQKEVRFIWEPKEKNKEVEPVVFTINQIHNNCRLCT